MTVDELKQALKDIPGHLRVVNLQYDEEKPATIKKVIVSDSSHDYGCRENIETYLRLVF